MIKLLGQTKIEVSGIVTSHFRWARATALLAYLLLNPGECSRELMADALWPDREGESARQNLRQTLLYLREILGPRNDEILSVTRQTVALNLALVQSDLEPFLSPPRKAEEYFKFRARYRKILELYKGPLLPNLSDEWLIPRRAEIARIYFNALIFLSKDALNDDVELALCLAETAIREEPFEDSARAAKILALRRLGRDATAQKEFAAYATFLQEQLASQPGRLVEYALKDELQIPLPNLIRDRTDASKATINETLEFLREQGMLQEASELAVALVPFWIRRGSPIEGQELLLSTFAADHKFSDSELLSLARLAYAQGDSQTARRQAEEVRNRANSDGAVAVSNLILSRLDLREMKPSSANRQALHALRHARRTKDRSIELESRFIMTLAKFSKDEFWKVERAADRVILLSENIGDHLTKKSASVYKAYAFQRLGQPNRAEEILETVLEDLLPVNSIVASQIMCSTARVWEDLGHVEKAAEMYRLCIDECKKLNNMFTLCVVQTYLGDLKAEMGFYDDSLKLHQEALQLRREFRQNLGIATSLRGVGKALLGKNSPGEARAALQESVQRFRDDDAASGHASSQLLLAEAVAREGAIPLAIRLCENSLDILRGLGPTARLTIGPSGATILERGEQLLRSMMGTKGPASVANQICSLLR